MGTVYGSVYGPVYGPVYEPVSDLIGWGGGLWYLIRPPDGYLDSEGLCRSLRWVAGRGAILTLTV